MGKVLDFVATQAELLAKRFAVSIAFVEACRTTGVSIPQGKAILLWFFRQPVDVRREVMKALLRDQTGQRK